MKGNDGRLLQGKGGAATACNAAVAAGSVEAGRAEGREGVAGGGSRVRWQLLQDGGRCSRSAGQSERRVAAGLEAGRTGKAE